MVWRLFLRKFKFIRELLGVQEPEDDTTYKSTLKRESNLDSSSKTTRKRVCLINKFSTDYTVY